LCLFCGVAVFRRRKSLRPALCTTSYFRRRLSFGQFAVGTSALENCDLLCSSTDSENLRWSPFHQITVRHAVGPVAHGCTYTAFKDCDLICSTTDFENLWWSPFYKTTLMHTVGPVADGYTSGVPHFRWDGITTNSSYRESG